jgi:putative DNA primase/helicase
MSTGSHRGAEVLVFQGKGGDGKSTIVNAVRHTLGTYATTVAVETFLDTGVKRGSEASPDIAALAGDTRFLCAGEPPSRVEAGHRGDQDLHRRRQP